MRKACQVFASLSLAVGIVVTCASFAQAQNREEHFVSARAGGVNVVSGEVTFRRAGRDAWQQLATTDELKSGDLVRTGADGRAEILLNPGSYLRLGENSEFELTDAALDTLRLKLVRGAALVEAAGFDDADFRIALDTPQTHVALIRSGIYRVNVAAGTTEVFVRKGRALVGRDQELVKEGMSARVAAAGNAEVAKFDKKEKDALDVWGKERAEEIARVTRKLQLKQINTALARTPWDSFYSSDNLFGLWFFSPRGNCYSFLPFYFWTSPYGYSYDLELPAIAYLCHSCHRPPGFNPNPYNPLINRTVAGGVTATTTTTTTTTNPSQGGGTNTGGGTWISPFPTGANTSPTIVNSPAPASRPGGTSAGRGVSPRDN
jgi:CBS domain-containing protein